MSAACLFGFIAQNATGSTEVDGLAVRAAQGDKAALDALVQRVRRTKDADAEYALGLMAYDGRGLERNAKQAFSLVERAASKGHAEASNMLGFFYEHGIGTSVNLALALESFLRGAESGSARARTNLGWFYEQGIGMNKDPVTAASWYKKAAEQGLPAAQMNLGALYESGEGVSRNPAIAIELYKTALAGGLRQAAFPIGRLLEERGILAGAADYYLIAAQAKVPEADFAAGRLMVAATNPRRNLAQGVYWLEQAAARDKPDALLLLAGLYDKGDAIARDAQKASTYFQRAAALGLTSDSR